MYGSWMGLRGHAEVKYKINANYKCIFSIKAVRGLHLQYVDVMDVESVEVMQRSCIGHEEVLKRSCRGQIQNRGLVM